MIRAALHPLLVRIRRLKGRIGEGQFNRLNPLSHGFGYDRGTPIDRRYIETFLAANQGDIRGRVLEIGDDSYSRRFGGARVTRQDVLHVDGTNRNATIVGDISDPQTLPSDAFDCIILTQTLHLIFDLKAAVRQVHRSLAPGGVALVTVPGVSSVDRGEWGGSWYWSMTGLSLERLLLEAFGEQGVSVTAFGNLFAATAFLHGACVEEIEQGKLDLIDPAYPVTIVSRARRSS